MGQAGSQAKYRKPSKLDPYINEIIDLYFNQGWTAARIGDRFGASVHAVADRIRRAGFQMKSIGISRVKGERLLDPHAADVVAMYTSGSGLSQIARRYCVSISTVSFFLRKVGCQTRSQSEAQHLRVGRRGPIQIGERFGFLEVIAGPVFPGHIKRRASYHVCRCVCGKEKPINTASLIEASRKPWGETRSCGCKRSKGERNPAHRHSGAFRGGVRTRLYGVWNGMRQRCQTPKALSYPSYGGRGIRVCEAWHDFAVFKAWAEASGYQRGLSIDRIDVNGHYEPDNCRWIPMSEQAANRRCNVYIEAFGERKCLAEWARDPRCVSQNVATLRARLRLGWGAEEAISKPPLWRNS